MFLLQEKQKVDGMSGLDLTVLHIILSTATLQIDCIFTVQQLEIHFIRYSHTGARGRV